MSHEAFVSLCHARQSPQGTQRSIKGKTPPPFLMLFLLAVSIVQAITVSGVEFAPDYSPGNVEAIAGGATITMN